MRLKRIAAASEKPHDTPSYSSTTVTAVCISQKKTHTCTENYISKTCFLPIPSQAIFVANSGVLEIVDYHLYLYRKSYVQDGFLLVRP